MNRILFKTSPQNAGSCFNRQFRCLPEIFRPKQINNSKIYESKIYTITDFSSIIIFTGKLLCNG